MRRYSEVATVGGREEVRVVRREEKRESEERSIGERESSGSPSRSVEPASSAVGGGKSHRLADSKRSASRCESDSATGAD